MPGQVHLQECRHTERLLRAKCRRTAPRWELLEGLSTANKHEGLQMRWRGPQLAPKQQGLPAGEQKDQKQVKKNKAVDISGHVNIAPKLLEIDDSE